MSDYIKRVAEKFQNYLEANYETGRFSVGLTTNDSFILYEHFRSPLNQILGCGHIIGTNTDEFNVKRTIQSLQMIFGVPVIYEFIGEVLPL